MAPSAPNNFDSSNSRPGTKKPRASFTVTFLDDPDVVALKARGITGDRAITIFFTLNLLAKKLKNKGRFTQPLSVIATMIYSAPKDIEAAIALINEVCQANKSRPWILHEKGGNLTVRSFTKWNDEKRGGHRENSGRKPKPKPNQSEIKLISNRNQNEIKTQSNTVASVSVPVPVSESNQQQQEPAAALPGAAAAGADAEEGHRRALLAEAGIGEPVISELVREAALTVPVLRQEIAAAIASGKHNGAIVLNLRARALAEGHKAQRKEQARVRQANTAEQEQRQREAENAARQAAEARYERLTPEELAAHHEAIYAGMNDKAKELLKPDSRVMRATVIGRLMGEGAKPHAL